MRKLFGLFILALLFTFVTPLPAETHETGPPGTVELIVPFDAEMQAAEMQLTEMTIYSLLEMGDFAFSPGDSYVKGHLCIDFQFGHALHSDNSYYLRAPETTADWQTLRQSKPGNFVNRQIDPGRRYHNKA